MALSTGIFSTFLCVKTVPLRSSPFLRVSPPHPANLRMVRAVTSATAASSEPSATKTREPRGIMKPRPVTPEMQDVVGESVIPRTQALKRIWAYIKEHDLQVNSLSLSLSVKRLYLYCRLIPNRVFLIAYWFKRDSFLIIWMRCETFLELSKNLLTAYVD